MDARLGRARRGALGALIATAVGAVALAVGPVAPAGAGARVANAPVVFVHGYLFNVCPGTDVAKVFASASAEMRSRGYTGKTEAVSYYACDKGGPSIQRSGNAKAYFSTGKQSGGNTNGTDLRHLAYELAWYLYDTYSSKGQTVELVGHSMGGLIMRWMLYQQQVRNPLFPPVLLVQDAVTLSTPHNGTRDSTGNATWCPGSIQCTQMQPGSAFLIELATHGMHPQGTGGTDWTAIGSAACDIMTPAQSTDMGDVHKVVYTGKKPACYNHTSYLTDTSDAVDMPVATRHPGDSTVVAGKGAHSLAWVHAAITQGTR